MSKIENKILDISYNNYNYLLKLHNVSGIGYGFKYINNTKIQEPCIHVLVKEKIPIKYLTKDNLIPKSYMGIKTDVIKIGTLKEKNNTNFNQHIKRIRPLEGGYDVSADTEKLGTIGCIVTNIIDGKRQYYILSNNHILADRNTISIGAPIYQPSLYYSNSRHKLVVGHLSTFVPIKYGKSSWFLKSNFMDCAIAKIKDESLISNRIAEIGAVKGVSKPKIDLPIKKVGAFSGLTEGVVETTGVTAISENSEGKFALFKKQILANIINSPGDSGSAVLNLKNEIVGLFSAGTDDDEFMMFTDINIIF